MIGKCDFCEKENIEIFDVDEVFLLFDGILFCYPWEAGKFHFGTKDAMEDIL